MDSEIERRMAGDFLILHALSIGDREIVLRERPASTNKGQYMCAFCEENVLMANYTDVMGSDDYADIVKLFGGRIAEQAEKTRIELNAPKIQGISNDPITAEDCEVINYQYDLRGKIVVIKPEALRPEYRHATCQLHLCDGGFGAAANSRGSACFCIELYSGKTSRFERDDIWHYRTREIT